MENPGAVPDTYELLTAKEGERLAVATSCFSLEK